MVVGDSDGPPQQGESSTASADPSPVASASRLDGSASARRAGDETGSFAEDPAIRAALDPAVSALLDAAALNDDEDSVADDDLRTDTRATDRSTEAVPMERPTAATSSPADTPDSPAGRHETETSDLAASISVRPTPGDAAAPAAVVDPDHVEFQAIIRQSVVEMIRAHGEANPGIEICGVMVGTVFENPQASFIYIDAMIRGESSSGRSTQVTFTAETWQHIDRVMEEKHKGKRILGWYHTHPGFGIFLSEMDLFIQRHFFNTPWQMAFVYDPKSHEAGMFAWRRGQVRRVDFVIDDEATPRTADEPNVRSSPAPLPPVTGGSTTILAPQSASFDNAAAPVNLATLTELADRVRMLEARVRWMLVGFAILALAVIIWPLVVGMVLPHQPGSGGGATTQPQKPQAETVLPYR